MTAIERTASYVINILFRIMYIMLNFVNLNLAL